MFVKVCYTDYDLICDICTGVMIAKLFMALYYESLEDLKQAILIYMFLLAF